MVLLPLIPRFYYPEQAYTLCIITLIVFGFLTGISQSSIFGYAGLLPEKYFASMSLGIGISGLGASILAGIFMLVYDPRKSYEGYLKGTLLYFVMCSVLLLLSACIYFVEKKSLFV
jgi:hypothetical protein